MNAHWRVKSSDTSQSMKASTCNSKVGWVSHRILNGARWLSEKDGGGPHLLPLVAEAAASLRGGSENGMGNEPHAHTATARNMMMQVVCVPDQCGSVLFSCE